ncbi:MAG TPA: hybrid sensor histidine kinase/response regulator [Pyrinomonadaceae bacterium]|nr:hybrid sensor histidine kinase/response regulator [Pyrinomonadaceae bacterium]
MDDLLNTAPCGFLSFTDDGYVVLVNDTLLALLGYGREELLGRHVESLFPVASRIFYQTHLFPLLKLHDRVEEVYFSLRTKGGAELPVLVNAARGERGGAVVNDCVMMHMRQRDQYEDEILRAKREAEEATRAKDEFLAVVSHELRTPLTAILGWARMLQTGKLDEATAARALGAIERNAESQNQLIGDLLDFSRIISGKVRLDVGRVELAPLVEAAIDVVSPAADAKGIRLQSVLDPKAGPVSGDPERLQQVFWNLLSNAVKFTPRSGRVQVRLARVNSSVEVAVSDTGSGISPEFLPYVFERFRQADQQTTRRQAGLGLGMAITKHLVELHGGTIRAESPGEGLGATFVLRLPVMIVHTADAPSDAAAGRLHVPAEEHARAAELVRLDGIHVLVVDDEPDARELLTTILRQAGAEATAAAGVADALDKLQKVKPDLLVSDIEMAHEDGYSLIRKVRALDSDRVRRIPAIALTAHARPSDRLRALSEGYHMHIPKPVEPAELVLAIANLTDRGGG